jgi:hypothetical protein
VIVIEGFKDARPMDVIVFSIKTVPVKISIYFIDTGKNCPKIITLNGGSLGSWVDEERS